ncbi:MAG: NDP-sugar synthase [Desulfobulbaceae bacterium]|nr:NDP-sugar synthase [Desulfobulbaceae bacterium]
MQAMILAAGLGTRLRPYSLKRPKPLFPLLGRPILLHLLEQLRNQGFDQLTVNAHHLREQFVSQLRHEPAVRVQLEDQILGTGGGLRQALPHFSAEPLLVLNGDTLFAADLVGLRQRHLASGARISLVVHDRTRFNNLRVLADGTIAGFRVGPEAIASGKGERLLAFTGIHFLDPAILSPIPPDGFCDIVEHYMALLAQGERINTLEVRDHFWADLGTPADYLFIHGELLRNRLSPWPEFLPRPAEPILIGSGVKIGADVRLEEWAMIGAGARVESGATVRRSVLWDGAVVPAGALVEDRIIVD